MLKKDGNSIPVRIVARDGKRELAVLPDGSVVLYAPPVLAKDISYLRNTIFRDIDNFLSPLADDEYIRVTPHKEDYCHLKQGTHRGSINHRDNIEEDGLSVGKRPEFPSRYAYYVTGECIGQGTDGEPLLNLASARPKGRLMRYETLAKDFSRRQEEHIRELGLTPEDMRLLCSVARIAV